jgi:ATP/maltotriose-dependent transcriptional regulator MalT
VGEAAEHTVASGAEGLLVTKLQVPRLPPVFVARSRLVDQLNAGLGRTLTLVCAPAGFGKTSVLADWCQHRALRVGWLTLDAADNDPVRFWRHVVAAFDRVRPAVAVHVAPLLDAPGIASFEGLVTTVVNEIAAEPDAMSLVLDDYHVIETELVHESLSFLIGHAPPGLHVVLASRADPPFPLARLRAQGQLTELRASDLRFTAEEAAGLLREAIGTDLSLPDAAVSALTTRTEGWAVGLQLAALSLRNQSDVTGFVETFSGSHRYVLDYLTDEVLEGQPDEVRAFLLDTSVLNRLSGKLCDAVTGRSDGQQKLEELERANLFLMPLDEFRGWWRYHQLFADLLRVRLQQEQPDRVPKLHHAAASWHEDHGLIDDAVRHAASAGEMKRVARLVEHNFDTLFMPGEIATLQRWLRVLPDELARSRPRLCLALAFIANAAGDMQATAHHLDAAERALASGPLDEPYEPSVGRAASLLANVPAGVALGRAVLASMSGDSDRVVALSSWMLTELRDGEWVLELFARQQLAVAQCLRGELGDAERVLASVITGWRAAGERRMAAWCCYHLGQIQQMRGQLDGALDVYEQALEITTAPAQRALPAAGIANVGIAEVAYQRGELDRALEHVTEGIELCQHLALRIALGSGLATLAWIRHAEGDAAGARAAIEEAERVAPSRAFADLFNRAPAQRARLLLAQGDVDAAAQFTTECGLSPEDEPCHAREPAYLVLARVLIAQEQLDRALRLLGRLNAAATSQGRSGSVIEIQALRTLALSAWGDEAGAVAALREALTLAHASGYVRVFVDEGPPMAVLLGTLLAAQRTDRLSVGDVPVDYLGRLMRAFTQDAARADGTVPVRGVVTPLSARELDVLRLMGAGEQNKEIAAELYMALNTVKKHVTHIFEKLGVTNRTEATARARELGILP